MAIAQRLTLEEFLKLPEEKPALEFFRGVVTQKVSPKLPHSVIQGLLVSWINAFGFARKLAVAMPELRTTYVGSSLVPDIAVFRWDRIRRDPRGEPIPDVVDPPDIAIEIISPGQTIRSQVRRCAWFIDNGAAIALLVLPTRRAAMIFRPAVEPRLLRHADQIDLEEVLPGFRLTVEELFDAASLR